MIEVRPFLTEAAAAELIGVPYRALKNERRAGRIAFHRVAARIMYLESDLREWQRDRCAAESWVYFIQGDPGTPIKIGFSAWAEIKYRISNLQSGNPQTLRLLCAAPGDRYWEKALHHEFATDRVRGEWFACSDKLLALVETLSKGATLFDALAKQGPDIRP